MPRQVSLHGNAVTVGEPPGPGQFENVDGVSWTDVVGYRRGWGSLFRGRPGFRWFHFPLPTTFRSGDGVYIIRLNLSFQIDGNASVDSIHVWEYLATRPTFTLDGAMARGSFSVAVIPNVPSGNPVGVAVGVNFREAATITFRGLSVWID